MAEQIIVSVDSDVAEFYRSVSEKDRRKLDLLVSLRLREAAVDGKSLVEIMDEISSGRRVTVRKSQINGATLNGHSG